MINQIIDEEMIHPDDHDNFLNFWDLPKLHETFSSNQHQILKGYFRKKRKQMVNTVGSYKPL